MAAFVGQIVRLGYHKPTLCLRRFSSALFMTGDEAKGTFSVVSPHIDIEEKLKEISLLKDNIEHRGLKINIGTIQELWDMLKTIQGNKLTLEGKRVDIANQIKLLKSNKDESTKEMDKLKMHGKILREDLKTTTRAIWELEKAVIPKILSLPNDLHDRTPRSDLQVIFQHGQEPNLKNVESHLEIGKRLGILNYISPEWCYLNGQAAIFDLGVLDYFANEISSHNFIKFCNSDFSRSVVVEGCGLDHENPGVSYILEDTDEILETKDVNRLHLVGGASLISFCAFHAKQNIPISSFPLRLVSIGRQYAPDNQGPKESNMSGLFGTSQSSSVGFCVSTKDHDSETEEFDKCLNLITDIYKKFGCPFRTVYVPAKDLKKHEMLRASVQVYSPHFGSYVEVGHVSMCGNYISKRLQIRYEVEDYSKFTHIVSGTAVSAPRLLGCLLELNHDVNDFVNIRVPDEVKKYVSCL